jgi:hypothetical protein
MSLSVLTVSFVTIHRYPCVQAPRSVRLFRPEGIFRCRILGLGTRGPLKTPSMWWHYMFWVSRVFWLWRFVFGNVTPCSLLDNIPTLRPFYPDDRDSGFIRNVATYICQPTRRHITESNRLYISTTIPYVSNLSYHNWFDWHNSLKVDSCSASQTYSPSFMEPEDSLPRSQGPPLMYCHVTEWLGTRFGLVTTYRS